MEAKKCTFLTFSVPHNLVFGDNQQPAPTSGDSATAAWMIGGDCRRSMIVGDRWLLPAIVAEY